MKPPKEGEPQTLEAQQKEQFTISQVLDSVYGELVSGFEGTPVIRQFDNEFFHWDSFHDINGSRGIYFTLQGVLFEVEQNKGILIVKSDDRETQWFSSLIKIVAWRKLEVGKERKYKINIRDYPSWDAVPLDRLIFELPKRTSEYSVRSATGGLLVNQGQRLALNGVIPMQPKFVAQKEAVDPDVIRGPGGVSILLDESRRETDEMYADDLVTSGTLYRPQVVPYLVGQIRKDLTRKHPRR